MIRIVLICYDGIGRALLHSAEQIVGNEIDGIDVIDIDQNLETGPLRSQLSSVLQNGSTPGNGTIVLVDVFGATHSKIALELAKNLEAPLVSGVNLPMLLRLVNYRNLEPGSSQYELAKKAEQGGREGVTLITDRDDD